MDSVDEFHLPPPPELEEAPNSPAPRMIQKKSRHRRNTSSSSGSSLSSERKVRFIHPETKKILENGRDHPSLIPTNSAGRPLLHSGSFRNAAASLGFVSAAQNSADEIRLQERIFKELERDFTELPFSLYKRGREVIRDGTMTRLRGFGRREEYHVHLFSDSFAYSERTPRGLLSLHKLIDLRFVEVSVPSRPVNQFAFKIKAPRHAMAWELKNNLRLSASSVDGMCSSPDSQDSLQLSSSPDDENVSSKGITFVVNSSTELMSWVSEIRMFIWRSRHGAIGRPIYWNRAFWESKFRNRKMFALEMRKIFRGERLVQMVKQGMDDGNDSENGMSPTPKAVPRLSHQLSTPVRRNHTRQLSANPILMRHQIMQANETVETKTKTARRHLSVGLIDRDQYQQPAISKLKKGRALEMDVVPEDYYQKITNHRLKHLADKEKYLEMMKKGAYIRKYDSRYQCTIRYFKVSEDGTELLWGKTPEKMTRSFFLADASRLEFGPHSSRFRTYRWEKGFGNPWLCFSIYFFDCARTVDFEFLSEEETRNWFIGIQSLIPLWNAFHMTKGELLWTQINMKLDCLSYETGLTRCQLYKKLLSKGEKLPNSARGEWKILSDNDRSLNQEYETDSDDQTIRPRAKSSILGSLFRFRRRSSGGEKEINSMSEPTRMSLELPIQEEDHENLEDTLAPEIMDISLRPELRIPDSPSSKSRSKTLSQGSFSISTKAKDVDEAGKAAEIPQSEATLNEKEAGYPEI